MRCGFALCGGFGGRTGLNAVRLLQTNVVMEHGKI